MAQSVMRGAAGGGAGGAGRVVGEYQMGKQIGSGSFSVVWHGRHVVHGTEVAIKEIATGRLNKKLQDSLMSEIFILKRIVHPHIIRLHDIIEKPGKVYLVLEYCKGGDLFMFLQRHGRVSESTAKHFMQQLAAGLQVLRDNNLMHRDLKPQNLLLSANDNNAVLKLADFGFARSLQPSILAETLCGSPLYMAPEIMQLQKYDAKADLWSVGAILFQLVTGRTPFTGNSQIQLLQNIVKSTELNFPPDSAALSFDCKDLCVKLLRRNPVERLTFEEFFNHPFLSRQPPEDLLRRSSMRIDYPITSSDCDLGRNTDDISEEDYLPFRLDDESSGIESLRRKPSVGSSINAKLDRREGASNTSTKLNITARYDCASRQMDSTGMRIDGPLDANLKIPSEHMGQGSCSVRSRVMDSMELIDQEYVIVSGPPVDVSSSAAGASRQSKISAKPGCPLPEAVQSNPSSSSPMPIMGATTTDSFRIGSLESQNSAPGTSHGSTDITDALERPSTHCMTRIKSLQQCASAITELVNGKIQTEKQLEAFSIQLVILAIWKQALHICHTQAASAMEGSPNQDSNRWRRSNSKKHSSADGHESIDVSSAEGTDVIASSIEREFLLEVDHAEELAKTIEPGTADMPDAMELIFQSALALGRNGAVDELMGDLENATMQYSKAVHLLIFLLVEAPALILNPPFSLTSSDRYRLRMYIDILNNRQGHSRSQRMALLKSDTLQGPP